MRTTTEKLTIKKKCGKVFKIFFCFQLYKEPVARHERLKFIFVGIPEGLGLILTVCLAHFCTDCFAKAFLQRRMKQCMLFDLRLKHNPCMPSTVSYLTWTCSTKTLILKVREMKMVMNAWNLTLCGPQGRKKIFLYREIFLFFFALPVCHVPQAINKSKFTWCVFILSSQWELPGAVGQHGHAERDRKTQQPACAFYSNSSKYYTSYISHFFIYRLTDEEKSILLVLTQEWFVAFSSVSRIWAAVIWWDSASSWCVRSSVWDAWSWRKERNTREDCAGRSE